LATLKITPKQEVFNTSGAKRNYIKLTNLWKRKTSFFGFGI